MSLPRKSEATAASVRRQELFQLATFRPASGKAKPCPDQAPQYEWSVILLQHRNVEDWCILGKQGNLAE